MVTVSLTGLPRMAKKLKPQQEREVIPRCVPHWLSFVTPNGQKIDTRVSGVPRIFECQIASYDRPASGEVREPFAEIGADARA